MTVKDVASPVIFREMVSAEAVVRGNEKTIRMARFEYVERPIILQIFGCKPDVMAEAARLLVDQYHPDGIDINMGCPVPKVTSTGSGSALMKDVELACEIVRAVVEAVDVEVSVKMRAGWTESSDLLEFAKAIEKAGAKMITIHGRTRKQGYSGYADWNIIKEAKEALGIPVLLNGDVFSAEDAASALDKTGVDGVMIARGALGNPWIFAQAREMLDNGKVETVPNVSDHVDLILAHAKRHVEQYGERGLVSFRKHLSWYTKGMAGAKEIRSALVRIESMEELEDLLNPIRSQEKMDLQRMKSPQPNG